MKISRLFHWLYAMLMLLPFAFFVPSVLYYAFNDNATMQSVEVPKTETIAVDFNQNVNADNLIPSTTYNGIDYIISNGFVLADGVGTGRSNLQVLSHRPNAIDSSHQCLIKGISGGSVSTYYIAVVYYANNQYVTYQTFVDEAIFYMPNNVESYQIECVACSSSGQVVNDLTFAPQIFDLTKMFGSGNEPTLARFNELFPNSYYSYNESKLMQITFDTGETEQLVQNTDIVNYAWESIWDLPLFSWSKVSFVAVPFTYITGLFGLAPSNSFNYVFTYFASMSIIWLVFDVILYVPLLVHRWLDKGIVE